MTRRWSELSASLKATWTEEQWRVYEAAKAEMTRLNGTDAAAVSMLSGLTAAELDELGGLPAVDDCEEVESD